MDKFNQKILGLKDKRSNSSIVDSQEHLEVIKAATLASWCDTDCDHFSLPPLDEYLADKKNLQDAEDVADIITQGAPPARRNAITRVSSSPNIQTPQQPRPPPQQPQQPQQPQPQQHQQRRRKSWLIQQKLKNALLVHPRASPLGQESNNNTSNINSNNISNNNSGGKVQSVGRTGQKIGRLERSLGGEGGSFRHKNSPLQTQTTEASAVGSLAKPQTQSPQSPPPQKAKQVALQETGVLKSGGSFGRRVQQPVQVSQEGWQKVAVKQGKPGERFLSDSGGVGLHAGESAGGVGRVRRGSEGALFTSSSKEILKNKAIGKALEEYYRVTQGQSQVPIQLKRSPSCKKNTSIMLNILTIPPPEPLYPEHIAATTYNILSTTSMYTYNIMFLLVPLALALGVLAGVLAASTTTALLCISLLWMFVIGLHMIRGFELAKASRRGKVYTARSVGTWYQSATRKSFAGEANQHNSTNNPLQRTSFTLSALPTDPKSQAQFKEVQKSVNEVERTLYGNIRSHQTLQARLQHLCQQLRVQFDEEELSTPQGTQRIAADIRNLVGC